jgi:hypothetical protein
MNTNIIRICIFLLPAVFLLGSCQPSDRDILHLMPDQTKLLFENEYVRVLNVFLEPGEIQPLHHGGNRLIYAQTNYTINYYQPDDTTEISWNKGGVHWHEAGLHAVENSGDTPADYFVFERKPVALPSTNHHTDELDYMMSENGFKHTVFENAHARVSHISIPSGGSIAEHEGLYRIVYSLSDYTIRYSSDVIGTVEREFKIGDFHWHVTDMHSIENIGEEHVEFLVIEFKQ